MVARATVNRVHRKSWRGIVIAAIATAFVPAVAEAIFIVNQPWARPAANAASTDAYMELTSTDGAALVGARSGFARSVVIVAPGGKTREVERLALPEGARVLLAPGAYRLRLTMLDRALKLGDRVPIVLTIEGVDGKRQEIPIAAEVRRRSPSDDERRTHHH